MNVSLRESLMAHGYTQGVIHYDECDYYFLEGLLHNHGKRRCSDGKQRNELNEAYAMGNLIGANELRSVDIYKE